jgi:hypothetical protein
MKACINRYRKVNKGEKVYRPDGTTHLVDEEIVCQAKNTCEGVLEAVQ